MVRRTQPFSTLLLLLCVALFAPSTVFCAAQESITETLLKNLTYSGTKLRDGKAEEPATQELGPSTVTLTDFLIGKPNPDGSQDAALRLTTSSDSTAVWANIYVVHVAGDRVTVMGPFELGDHIGVQFTRIGQGRIDAVLRVYGPNDAHCCPSLTRKDNFRYGPKGIDEFGGVIGKPGARNGGPSGQDEQTIKHYSLASLGIPQAGASTAAPAQPTPPETKKTSGSLNDILARNHITAMLPFQAGFDIQGDTSPYGKFRLLLFAPLDPATGKPARTPRYDNIFLLSQPIGRILRTPHSAIGITYLSKKMADIYVIPNDGGPSRVYRCQVHPDQGYRYSDFVLQPDRKASDEQIRLVRSAIEYFDTVATDLVDRATTYTGIADQGSPKVQASQQASQGWIQSAGIENTAGTTARQ